VYRPQQLPKVLQAKSKADGAAAPARGGERLVAPARPPVVGVIQRRGYDNSVIDAFINKNRATFVRGGKDKSVDVNAITELFISTHQYKDREDLKYLRNKVNKHTTPLKSHPAALTYPLAANFSEHVLGDSAGVGWHTESKHANGDLNYSYVNWGWIAQTKGTYWATTLIIKGTAKTGNNGNGTFFPSTMSIDLIAEEAEYVANTYTPKGQLVIGRGRRTGIMIECILRLDKVESAYPFKPGW
jgi:hypothetical protein